MRILKIIFWVAVLFAGYTYFTVSTFTVAKQDFIIRSWDTVASLRNKLHMDINPLLYKLVTKLSYNDAVLQAGTYHMDEDQTLKDFFTKTLKKPTSKDVTITILPGWNIFDIDAMLSGQGMIQAGSLISIAEDIPGGIRKDFPFLSGVTSMEGFLLPDTYRVKPTATADNIARVLLRGFENKIYSQYSFSSPKKFYETLIFASILEKEEKSTINKPIVAGVLQKRYDEGELIGADATVCYAYRLTMTDCTPSFIGEHVGIKTKYNTRKNLSLPPTPIANPSPDTFRATIDPESSPYYYYLHDDSGNIHYGRTLEEHNRNRVLYLGK